jgi:hypothetical protein
MARGSPPSHNLVIKVGRDAPWVKIGAAWPTRTGDGMMLKLNPCVLLDWKDVNHEDTALALFVNKYGADHDTVDPPAKKPTRPPDDDGDIPFRSRLPARARSAAVEEGA